MPANTAEGAYKESPHVGARGPVSKLQDNELNWPREISGGWPINRPPMSESTHNLEKCPRPQKLENNENCPKMGHHDQLGGQHTTKGQTDTTSELNHRNTWTRRLASWFLTHPENDLLTKRWFWRWKTLLENSRTTVGRSRSKKNADVRALPSQRKWSNNADVLLMEMPANNQRRRRLSKALAMIPCQSGQRKREHKESRHTTQQWENTHTHIGWISARLMRERYNPRVERALWVWAEFSVNERGCRRSVWNSTLDAYL